MVCGSAAGERVEKCVRGVVLREADSQAWSPSSDRVSSFKYVDQRLAGLPCPSMYGEGRGPLALPGHLSGHGRGVPLARGGGMDAEAAPTAVRWSPAGDSQLAHSSEEQLWRCPPAVVDHLDLNCPVILGTDWPGFNNLLLQCVSVVSVLRHRLSKTFLAFLWGLTPPVITHYSSLVMKLYT